MELLRRFIRDRSETAFRGLVELHSPLVHATALRRLGGDRAAAQDVMQEVFTLLARKAAALQSVQLGGWLYRQTCRRAANHARAESRRRAREAVAAMAVTGHGAEPEHSDLSGEVDEAMLGLPDADRDALVLRYFEARDFRNVGGRLGISEEAARKRVDRAMEKLCALLKRRGIATGGALLGSTMSGMGKCVVPQAMVAQITSHAIQALPAAGWGTLSGGLKPFLAGAVVSSLIASSAHLLRQPSGAAAPAPAATPSGATAAKSPRPDNLGPLPSGSSLDDVITEIKRVNSGPANALTGLRLQAVLDRIANDRIPAFIELANGRLNAQERAVSYTRLLERWANTDADAALSYTAKQKVGAQVDSASGTNLLSNLFSSWIQRDRTAAAAWLNRNWKLDTLAEPAFENSLRDSMCIKIAEDCMLRDGKEGLLAFLRTLPCPEDQKTALSPLCGGFSRYQGVFINAGSERLIECYQALKELPDEALRNSAMTGFWKNLAEQRPADLVAMKASLDPEERFTLALGQLGTRQIATGREPLVSGGFVGKSEPVTNRAALEAAAMEAGHAAGLPPEEIMNGIAEVMVGTLQGPERLAWLEQHRGEFEIDSTLAGMIRDQAGSNGTLGGERNEMIGILLAAHISDPELRLSLGRGAYRRMLDRSRPAALACLGRSELPAEFVAEFRRISGEAP